MKSWMRYTKILDEARAAGTQVRCKRCCEWKQPDEICRGKAGFKCKACAAAETFRDKRAAPWKAKLISIRSRAKQRGVPCTITEDDLKGLWERQGGLCYYTGWPMRVLGPQDVKVKVGVIADDSASVDCKNPTLGYVPDNIVLCLHRVNCFKCRMSEDEMVRMAAAIAETGRAREGSRAALPARRPGTGPGCT